MEDEEKKEIKEEEKTEEDNKSDSENSTTVENIEKDYKEIKEANDKVAEELLRRENLRAEMAKGGKSDAGQIVKEKTQDEKDEEAARAFMEDDEDK